MASARTKIENSKNAPVEADEENDDGEEKGDDSDVYYGEEADAGNGGDVAVSIKAMEIFVSGMKQFEEFLVSQTTQGGDDEYYDEEEGAEGEAEDY